MWIILIFLIIIFILVIYFQPKPKYYSYPVWDPSDPARFLYILSLNVYLSNSKLVPAPEGFTVKPIGSYGYALENDDTVIIAYTGTFYDYQWKLDLENKLVSINNSEVKVHQGYDKIYNSIKDDIHKLDLENKDLYITGISLGGAIASINALDLYQYNPEVYTFGSPKVFNIEGSKLVNNLVPTIHRIYNTADVVPDYPFSPEYRPVGNPEPFTIKLGSIIKNHTEAYKDYFKVNPT
jgi:hypothetical protein